MNNSRMLLKVIGTAMNSPTFNLITYRLGAYLLLLTNLILPLGQHRLWSKIEGWWLFPVGFCLAAFGSWRYLCSGIEIWKMFSLPFALLFIFDSLLLSIAPAPFEGHKK